MSIAQEQLIHRNHEAISVSLKYVLEKVDYQYKKSHYICEINSILKLMQY